MNRLGIRRRRRRTGVIRIPLLAKFVRRCKTGDCVNLPVAGVHDKVDVRTRELCAE